MKIYKKYSEKFRKHYIVVDIEKSEVEGLQGDLEILFACERSKDSPVPTIGWRIEIDGNKYGDFMHVHVPVEKIKNESSPTLD